jgi:hypothetical protein
MICISACHPVLCGSCRAPVGKMYVTTLPFMDSFRGQFALSVEAVASYELGSGNDLAITARSSSLEQVDSSIQELKTVMLVMEERLRALESSSADGTTQNTDQGGEREKEKPARGRKRKS